MSSIGGKNYKKIKKQPKDAENAKYIVSKKDFDGSIYAKVQSMFGSGRLSALGQDNIMYNCVIRGRLYKKVWIKKDDIIIIDPRGFEKQKTGNMPNADVLYKLSENEIHQNDVSQIFTELELQKDAAANPGDAFEFDRTNDGKEFEFDEL